MSSDKTDRRGFLGGLLKLTPLLALAPLAESASPTAGPEELLNVFNPTCPECRMLLPMDVSKNKRWLATHLQFQNHRCPNSDKSYEFRENKWVRVQ